MINLSLQCFPLFPQDENGINRPVCSYIKPLRAGRLLDTPRQAARFVNVLGYERAPVIGGGGKQEQWCTLLAFLCRNKVPYICNRIENQYIFVIVNLLHLKIINLEKWIYCPFELVRIFCFQYIKKNLGIFIFLYSFLFSVI